MRKRIRLLAYVCLLSASSFAQPAAEFGAGSVSGCAPMVVQFQDLSTGNPTSWFWDLGNGTVSYLQNPSVSYLQPGNYTVRLTVQNSSGTSTVIKNNFITVYEKPSVNFGSSVTSGCFPLTVQFSDSSRLISGTINRWLWDFGDGNFSTLQSPSHTYRSAGSFNVSLRVTSDAGCSNSISRPFYIRTYEGGNADFETSIISGCSLPATVNFSNLSAGNGNLQFSWDLGDGNTSNLVNPSHTYSANGNYQVRLIVTNSFGCADTISKNLNIAIGNISVSFNTSGSLCGGQQVTFNNQSAPAPVSSYWDFGNGTSSTLLNPTVSYPQPGNYFVKLVSDFGGCKDSSTQMITIASKPIAGFTTADTISCKLPFIVRFRNQSLNAANYIWNFGDGSSATDPNPTHTYTRAGIYTVTLVSINDTGCRDTMVRSSIVKITLPEGRIENLPQMGCAPFTWTFGSSFTGIEPANSYLWDFGNGNTSTEANPTHTFDSGTYTIRLIITTAGGCTDTTEVLNGIRVGTLPVAGFSATPRNTCANIPVVFTDESLGNITQRLWLFGDGGTSTQANPSYTYSDTGYFTVTLIVFNNGCSDTLIVPDYIYINPPIARLIYNIDCNNKFTRSFIGSRSVGADEYFWDFGDGNTSTAANPVHTYAATGRYDVTLKVRNIRSGCESIRTRTLDIVNEYADFEVSAQESCRNNPLTFSAINSNAANIRSYQWSFGDGGTGTGRNATYSYPRSGNYQVRLIITDIVGCRDTMTKPAFIRINGPVAAISSPVNTGCPNTPIQFNDNSVTDGVNSIVTRVWNFGDGNTISTTNTTISHTYSSPGNYTVSLQVTDSKGCTDQRTIRNMIRISRPTASFTTTDTLTCPGKNVRFTNRSSGTGLRYLWNFGDGFTDTSASPIHIYGQDGLYTVILKVTDQFGCTDSIVRVNYIKLTTGIARFTASDTITNCPPLVVSFTNTSLHTVSYQWDFGDGTSSRLVNPSHFYSAAGVYVVKLVAKGVGGCYSQYQQTITILGPSGNFTYSPLSGCKPLQVRFTASIRNTNSILWDFSDGNTITTTDTTVTHTYTIPGYYVPRMILSNNDGCSVPIQGTDTIRVFGVNTAFEFDNLTICDSGNISFRNQSMSSDSIVSYQWQFGDGNISTQKNPTHRYTLPGTYFPMLTVITVNGCRDSLRSSLPVRIFESPRAVIERSPDGCLPLSVSFNGVIDQPDSLSINWNWNFGNGQSSASQQPGNINYTTAGNYNITAVAINAAGCSDTATAIIRAYALPVVEAGNDAISCHGTGTVLQATGASTYQWSPSSGLSCTDCPNPTAQPDSSKMYFVTGFSDKGCSASDSVWISVKYPFEMTISRADSVCKGESVFMYAQGAHHYSWTPATTSIGQHNSVVTVKPETSTIYRVTGTDDANCFSQTLEIPITVFPVPTVEAGEDITIAVGRSVDLTPVVSSDVTEINWSPTGSIYRSAYPSITVKPRVTTEYTVEVANQGGCTATDNLTVYVTCEGSNVFIPNSFTPNQDGMNDIFYPRGSGLFRVKSMRIFNRWGEVVFLRNDFMPNNASTGWDGTYKGRPLNPDVYVYMIEIICDNNATLIHRGNIALLK